MNIYMSSVLSIFNSLDVALVLDPKINEGKKSQKCFKAINALGANQQRQIDGGVRIINYTVSYRTLIPFQNNNKKVPQVLNYRTTSILQVQIQNPNMHDPHELSLILLFTIKIVFICNILVFVKSL